MPSIGFVVTMLDLIQSMKILKCHHMFVVYLTLACVSLPASFYIIIIIIIIHNCKVIFRVDDFLANRFDSFYRVVPMTGMEKTTSKVQFCPL